MLNIVSVQRFINKYKPFLFFGVFALFFLTRGIILHQKLNRDSRYAIGRIVTLSSSIDGGPMATYVYDVYKKSYSGTFSVSFENDEAKKINDRFVVKFSKSKPEISYPLTKEKLDSNISVPDSGWSTIPSVRK